MRKVITYGTFDLLHHGHVRLLERAKELGDFLIVGVTSEDFDKQRGKFNVKQSLVERIAAVRETGLADMVLVEEYPGQKIDDIRRYGVDTFAIGSDWKGHFDYLGEYCEVVYLSRTEGVSSTQLRSERGRLRLGVVGDDAYVAKVISEAKLVNGLEVAGCVGRNVSAKSPEYAELLDSVDAVYIRTEPENHFELARRALLEGRHVLCECPGAMSAEQSDEMFSLASEGRVAFVDAVKTAYATAYSRMLLLVKMGMIGEVVSVDAVCTSMREESGGSSSWGSMSAWGPTAMLPVFHILGTDYIDKRAWALFDDADQRSDAFAKVDFHYPNAVASIRVAKGAKAEGELVIAGTKGYVYVPAPWWKTDYFEVRFEDASQNRRYFYQLDGDGIRYELVSFLNTIERGGDCPYMPHGISMAIDQVVGDFYAGNDLKTLKSDGKAARVNGD